MKNSKKFIIVAVSLVLASALALSGCMHLISESSEETKEYNPDEMRLPSVIGETPTAQSEMQKKFGAYGKEEIGANREKIFRLFTEEQIEESLRLRGEGVRRSLTYEEILFIINDSVRMYFEYDKIIITDFVNHTHAEPTGILDYDLRMSLNNDNYDKCEVSSFEYAEIVPYHGNYSECQSYLSAVETYSMMIRDIETIILDRLRIHDTGTESYCLTSVLNPSDYTRLHGILLDGGELTDSEEYVSTLGYNIKSNLVYVAEDVEGERPMILAVDKYDPDSVRPRLTIQYCDGKKRTQLFPTEELEVLKPDGSIILTGKTNENSPREYTIEFDRWLGKVKYTEKMKGYELVATGGFAYDEGILILVFGNYENIYLKYVDGKIRIFDNSYDAYYKGKFDAEIVFECSSAYGEEFVFADAFIHNCFPIRVYYE